MVSAMKKSKRLKSQFYKSVKDLLRAYLPQIGTQVAAQMARAAIKVGLALEDSEGRVYLVKEEHRK